MTSASRRPGGIPSPNASPAVWLVLILIAFIALSLVYSINLPLFEGFDETAHYRVVDAYALRATLPDLTHAPSHEAHQPPLYYVVGALLIAPIDRSDFDAVFQINPNSAVNVRQNVEAPDPLRLTGVTLALRILRLLSTILGAMTVALAYVLARQLLMSAPFSLLAAALLAFNPKFIMLSAAVSNDIAVLCAATLCLALCARFMHRPPTARNAFLLGASVGLAALCKNSGLGLGLPAVFAIVWSAVTATPAQHTSSIRRVAVCLTMTALGGLLIAGWLFAVQWVRYGSPLAWEQVNMLNRFSLRLTPLDIGQMVAILPSILPTLWRINPALPLQTAGDALFGVILVIAMIGWVIGIARRKLPGTFGLLPIAILGSLIALMPWMRLYGGTEDSRLLPTVFSGIAVLSAAGFAVIGMYRKAQRTQLSVVALVMSLSLLWAGIAPFTLLAPTFADVTPIPSEGFIHQLSALDRAQLPQSPVALFENGIELAQAVMVTDRLSSGDPLPLTLTWRVTRPVMRPYILTLEAFDAQNHSLGKLETLPWGGRRSTGVWQVGDVYRETYTLTLATLTNDSPLAATVFAGWHETTPPYTISNVVGSTGLTAALGRIKVRATQTPIAVQHPIDAIFGGIIALEGYDLLSGTLTLHWRAIGPVLLNYQVYVHVIDARGKPGGQVDGPLPLPASLWDAGETVLDRRQIPDLPKGGSILVGVYDLGTSVRLPAVRADGRPLTDDGAVLAP